VFRLQGRQNKKLNSVRKNKKIKARGRCDARCSEEKTKAKKKGQGGFESAGRVGVEMVFLKKKKKEQVLGTTKKNAGRSRGIRREAEYERGKKPRLPPSGQEKTGEREAGAMPLLSSFGISI